MQPDLLTGPRAAPLLHHLRSRSPLVHCMTNDVVQTFTANVLLALGASPAMIVEAQEAVQFSTVADALLINVGTLTAKHAQAMRDAVTSVRQQQKPWTLDPVAVGALSFRSTFARQLIELQPAAIRGNASEIMALAGENSGGRGVDSIHSTQNAAQAAQALAQRTGAIVAVTGVTDYVTDGQQSIVVKGGDALMTRVVGTGCALSAVVAASCALPGERLENVAAACWIMKTAGQRAVAVSRGPGSFVPAFLDALWLLDKEVAQ